MQFAFRLCNSTEPIKVMNSIVTCVIHKLHSLHNFDRQMHKLIQVKNIYTLKVGVVTHESAFQSA
jgi:hypothetical protein